MIEDAATTPPGGPSAVLLSRDLLFNSKITGTARELGHRVLVASTLPMATEMLTQWRPKVVFVDLAAGDFVETLAIVAFRAIVPESRVHRLRFACRRRPARRRPRRGVRPGAPSEQIYGDAAGTDRALPRPRGIIRGVGVVEEAVAGGLSPVGMDRAIEPDELADGGIGPSGAAVRADEPVEHVVSDPDVPSPEPFELPEGVEALGQAGDLAEAGVAERHQFVDARQRRRVTPLVGDDAAVEVIQGAFAAGALQWAARVRRRGVRPATGRRPGRAAASGSCPGSRRWR